MKSRLFLSGVLVLVIFILISASSALTAPAGTNVGGPIISDTTWTLAGSPYIVIANVQVLTGVKLTIQPGVVVKFNAGKLLQVDGTLIARGTSTTPITFTSNLPNPQPGDWGNIEFTDTSADAVFDTMENYASGSVLQYCLVDFGGSNTASVDTNNASPLIDHCVIRNSFLNGIQAIGTAGVPIVIRNNTVYGNGLLYEYDLSGGGIRALYGKITSNTVTGNSAYSRGGGIFVENSVVSSNIVDENSSYTAGGIGAVRSVITGNIVRANTGQDDGAGIRAWDMTTVTNNIVSDNSTIGWGCGGGIHGYWTRIEGNTVSANSTDGGGGGICGDRSTIVENTVIGNSSYGSGGGISAFGSSVIGNIVSGNSTKYSVGGGINAYNGSIVLSNTVTGNKVSITGQGSGVYFDSYNDDFLYNTIVGNTTISPTIAEIGGVAIVRTPQFHYNTLYNNFPYDVVVVSSEDISGTDNYWGTVNTVDILAHVYDWYDDTSRGRLLYIPYLQDPDPNAPVPPPTNLQANFSDSSVALSWDPIPSLTTGYGYKIYYDTDGQRPPYNGLGILQGTSPIYAGNTTSFTLCGLNKQTYYIAVTAHDTLGHESWYSNEVSNPYKIYLPIVLKSSIGLINLSSAKADSGMMPSKNLIDCSTPAPTPTPTPTPGAVILYYYTWGDGTTCNRDCAYWGGGYTGDYNQTIHTFGNPGGAMTLYFGGTNVIYGAGVISPASTNYEYSTDMKLLKGYQDARFGLIFSASSSAITWPPSFHPEFDYYKLEIQVSTTDPDVLTMMQLHQCVNGVCGSLTPNLTLPGSPRTGQWHNVKIRQVGNNFKLYFDNIQLGGDSIFGDPTWNTSRRRYGVFLQAKDYNNADAPLELHWDNAIITFLP